MSELQPIFDRLSGRAMLLAIFLAMPLALLLPASPSLALSPMPPQPSAEDWAAFYQATDGENWQRNDGWLDDEIHPCDWYGVICDDSLGTPLVSGLSLPDNNLSGSISDLLESSIGLSSSLLSFLSTRLDLSDNQLSGTLARIPIWISHVNLARNRFEGELPDTRAGLIVGTPPPELFQGLSYLDLSGNQLRGRVPDDWNRLTLSVLDLSNNALDAGIENAFAAIRSAAGGELYLTDNRFSGSPDPAIIETSLWQTDLPVSGGGLNLCWNQLDIDDPALIDFIDDHHVAGPGWQDCQSRNREKIDPTISGSWFSPFRSGEGVSLMLLDTGAPLVYAFTYNLEAEQQWFFELGRAGEEFLDWPNLLETRGDFANGLRMVEDEAALRSIARLRMDRLGNHVMQFERVFIDYSGCPPFDGRPPAEGDPVPLPCPIFPVSDRINQIQLTRLAGSTCDNQTDHQWISGAWFNPDSAGEGFIVEVIEDGRGVVYWFTYTADGSGQQTWLTADAHFEGNTLRLDMLQPVGATYGPLFNRDAIVLEDWGQLTLEFSDPDSATARYDSHLSDYGAGEFTLERLARPMLAECDN